MGGLIRPSRFFFSQEKLTNVRNNNDNYRLVESDILYRVPSINWESPVVHVPKSDGSYEYVGTTRELMSV